MNNYEKNYIRTKFDLINSIWNNNIHINFKPKLKFSEVIIYLFIPLLPFVSLLNSNLVKVVPFKPSHLSLSFLSIHESRPKTLQPIFHDNHLFGRLSVEYVSARNGDECKERNKESTYLMGFFTKTQNPHKNDGCTFQAFKNPRQKCQLDVYGNVLSTVFPCVFG